MASASGSSRHETIYDLEENNELRFEVEAGNAVTLELLSGLGEIFGTELVPNKTYSFPTSVKLAIAVYTFHGCKVKLSGSTEVAYVAKQTPMQIYVNTHAALEQLRDQALEQKGRGPRVMVCGAADVGKSTLCRILTNYAVSEGFTQNSSWLQQSHLNIALWASNVNRCDRTPMLIELDVGQGDIAIPGTIGALIVQKPHDIEEGFSQSLPLLYHFGHNTPSDNVLLYNQLVSTLAQTVNLRCEQNKPTNISGCIINTGSWIKGAGYKSLVHIAGAFEVDIVIVIDQERLFNEIRKDMPNFVRVVQLKKSGGVVERNRTIRIDARDDRVRSYFYGIKGQLSPHCFSVNFGDIRIFKIGAPELPDSLLPLGVKLTEEKTKVMPLIPSPALKHHVLSVSACESADDNLINTNVIGFIVITEVDMERMRIMVLAPAPAPLPRNILLDTDITFMDIK